MFKYIAAVTCLLLSVPASADPIQADRPGIGTDVQTVPVGDIQAEVGTDAYEVRYGLSNDLEIMKDNTSEGVKYQFLNKKFKGSVKISYDSTLGVYGELPLEYDFTDKFTVSTDIIISKMSQTYAAEFNYSPKSDITLTNSVYYDTKPRWAISIAYIPPKQQYVQFDASLVNKKPVVGISFRF